MLCQIQGIFKRRLELGTSYADSVLTRMIMVGIIKLLGHCIGGNFNIHGGGSAISSAQGGISGLEVVKLFSNMVNKLFVPCRHAFHETHIYQPVQQRSSAFVVSQNVFAAYSTKKV